MDIATGKDLPKTATKKTDQELNRDYFNLDFTKIWGYDLALPTQDFSVSQYIKSIKPVITDVLSRGKLPTLVGGTGFYIDALLNPPATSEIKPNLELRKSLEELTKDQLQARLKATNQLRLEQMNNSDKNNPRRLIRAIEVETANKPSLQSSSNDLQPFWIGLDLPVDQLHKNIQARVVTRFTKLKAEIETLNQLGVDWTQNPATAFGYQQFQAFTRGEITKQQAIEVWTQKEIAYSKRQKTWFKKNPRINWFDSSNSNLETSIESQVQAWYSDTGGKNGKNQRS